MRERKCRKDRLDMPQIRSIARVREKLLKGKVDIGVASDEGRYKVGEEGMIMTRGDDFKKRPTGAKRRIRDVKRRKEGKGRERRRKGRRGAGCKEGDGVASLITTKTYNQKRNRNVKKKEK